MGIVCLVLLVVLDMLNEKKSLNVKYGVTHTHTHTFFMHGFSGKTLLIAYLQDQWKRGQPVIVSDVTKHLDMSLWHPDSFARDFGEDKNDLINCMTGNLVPNQPMRKFWEGFEHFSRRLKDDRGNPMLLKLKDWPPGTGLLMC